MSGWKHEYSYENTLVFNSFLTLAHCFLIDSEEIEVLVSLRNTQLLSF